MEDYTIPYYTLEAFEYDADDPEMTVPFVIDLIIKHLNEGIDREGRVAIGDPEITFDFANAKKGRYDHYWVTCYIKQKVKAKKLR